MKNGWCCIAADFQELFVISWLAFLPTKAANTFIMEWHRCIAIWLSRMEDPKTLMLCWRNSSAGSSGTRTSILAHTGGQCWDSVWLPVHSPVSIQDARSKIVDFPLTLDSMMGQGSCRLPFYLSRRPVHPLRMDTTMQPFDCWMGKTLNCWRSVDAHLRAR